MYSIVVKLVAFRTSMPPHLFFGTPLPHSNRNKSININEEKNGLCRGVSLHQVFQEIGSNQIFMILTFLNLGTSTEQAAHAGNAFIMRTPNYLSRILNMAIRKLKDSTKTYAERNARQVNIAFFADHEGFIGKRISQL